MNPKKSAEGANTFSKVSPTRTKATWKPGITNDPIPFFRCSTCGAIVCGLDGVNGIEQGGGLERRPDAKLPYASNTFSPSCCGTPMEMINNTSTHTAEELGLTYKMVGGFDINAMRVSWKFGGPAPRWVALKTFTGMQMKYVLPKKNPPLVFAFGDEDAYAYCDEDPCVNCTFHCKRGFEIYAYYEDAGLICIPVHQEDLLR